MAPLIAVALVVGQLSEWPLDAAALRGELKRDLIAAGICLAIGLSIWAFQEWDMRRAAGALGWFGGLALVVVAIGVAMLIATGLL